MWTVLGQIWRTDNLRNKILVTLGLLFVFRIAAHITVPGADVAVIESLQNSIAAGNDSASGLAILSLLTGGAMERFSLVLMGLTPYINASIILQLLGVIVPSIENLKKQGEQGQKKISQWTRILTVPLAALQSFGMMYFINQTSLSAVGLPILDTSDWGVMLPAMLTVTAGTVFLMWLGELITEKGIGNGISLIIFAGIVAVVPTQIATAFSSAGPLVNLGLVALTVALTMFVVYVAEADRRVPIMYASRKAGGQQIRSFLPMKINQGGMIPIIFAVSVLSMPSILSQLMAQSEAIWAQNMVTWIGRHLTPGSTGITYNLLYAILIIAFTYFYVSIVFEPKKVAENIQKRGGFVPGYRPGAETEGLIEGISSRLVFWGAIFLAFVAVAPIFFERVITGGLRGVTMFIGGAGIIIVVGVVLDLIRRINSQLVMHDYDTL